MYAQLMDFTQVWNWLELYNDTIDISICYYCEAAVKQFMLYKRLYK